MRGNIGYDPAARYPLSPRYVRGVLSEHHWDPETAAEAILTRLNEEGQPGSTLIYKIPYDAITLLRVAAQVQHIWQVEQHRRGRSLKL